MSFRLLVLSDDCRNFPWPLYSVLNVQFSADESNRLGLGIPLDVIAVALFALDNFAAVDLGIAKVAPVQRRGQAEKIVVKLLSSFGSVKPC